MKNAIKFTGIVFEGLPKFSFSEKATQIWSNLPQGYLVTSKPWEWLHQLFVAFLEKLNFEIPCKSLHEFYQIKLSLQKPCNLITELVTVLVMVVAVVVAVIVAISFGLTEVSVIWGCWPVKGNRLGIGRGNSTAEFRG